MLENGKLGFGPYEFDPLSGRLTKSGMRIKLQPRAAAVLAALLNRPGETVTREELQKKVWPEGTHVDFDLGIKVAVKKLRDALCDAADEPKYVQTVVGEGYRFIGPVEAVRAEELEQSVAEVAGPAMACGAQPVPWWRRNPIVWSAGSATVVSLAVALVFIGAFHGRTAISYAKGDWVLICSFDNRTGNKLLDGTLEYAVTRELSNSQFVNVVPRQRVNDALRLMRAPENSRLDASLGRQICLRDGGIRALLTGRIEKLGGTYVLSTSIVNPSNGQIVATLSEEVGDVSRLAGAVRHLSDQVREALGEQVDRIQVSEQHLEQVTTPSLHALQLYTQADRLMYGSNEDVRVAGKLLEQALQEDRGFASAHVLLGYVYTDLGNDGLAAKHFRRAYELARTTTDRERYFIYGSFYGSNAVHDPRKAIDAYETVLRLFPDDYWAADNLLVQYTRAGMDDKVVPMELRLATLRPNDYRINMQATVALIFQAAEQARPAVDGHIPPAAFNDARKYLDRALRLSDGEEARSHNFAGLSPRLFAGFIGLLEGNIAEARANITEAARLESFRHPGAVGIAFADIGDLHEAEKWMSGPPDGVPAINVALLEFLRGDVAAMRKYLRRDKVPYYALADASIMMVHCGMVPEAKALVARWRMFQKHPPDGAPPPPGDLEIIQGELALARGDMATGTRLLEDAVRRRMEFGASATYMAEDDLAQAYESRGRLGDAVRVLKPGSTAPIAMNFSPAFRMRVQFDLARLEHKIGRNSDAENIEADLGNELRFADPDHPLLHRLEQEESSSSTAPQPQSAAFETSTHERQVRRTHLQRN